MNIKITIFLFAGCIALSCNKPLPDYSGLPFDYTVTGIKDDTIPSNDVFIFSPSIKLVSGDAATNPITVTFKGLPANVTAAKDNFTFRLNYDLGDSFIARNAVLGSYPIQVIFSNPTIGTKVYNFNLVVAAPVDRVGRVSGYYYPTNSCLNNEYVSCEIDGVPGSPGKIMIIDRTGISRLTYGTFDTSYGIVDCCSNTFVIPSQKVGGYTVSGDGSFNDQTSPNKKVTINRTYITDTATYPCTVDLYQN